jgi:hypothetical protein
VITLTKAASRILTTATTATKPETSSNLTTPAPRADHDDSLTYYQAMEFAARELLIEKGVLTANDVLQTAHARGRLRGSARTRQLGLEVGPMKLIVVENTPDLPGRA